MAAGPCYMNSARAAQRTPLPTALLLLLESVTVINLHLPLFTEPLLSNAYCIAAYFVVVCLASGTHAIILRIFVRSYSLQIGRAFDVSIE
jgi:hypothetical protein